MTSAIPAPRWTCGAARPQRGPGLPRSSCTQPHGHLSLDAHPPGWTANSARSDINSSATGKNPRGRAMQTGLRTGQMATAGRW